MIVTCVAVIYDDGPDSKSMIYGRPVCERQFSLDMMQNFQTDYKSISTTVVNEWSLGVKDRFQDNIGQAFWLSTDVMASKLW